MPAVLVTRPTAMQDSPFFPSSGFKHSQYSFLPTHGEIAQAETTWVPGSVPRRYICPKTVSHPGTNRVQHKPTILIEANTLPLGHTGQ